MYVFMIFINFLRKKKNICINLIFNSQFISKLQLNQMEEEEAEDEEMGVAETYADYWPAKCNFFFLILNFHVMFNVKNVKQCQMFLCFFLNFHFSLFHKKNN
jgi:hypothetical protein